MKRPNGYGAVVNLGKGRRKPYGVRIFDRVASSVPDDDGICRKKYRYIGYYQTKAEAYAALDKYNEDKAPINYIGITFKEIWDKWAERNLDNGSVSRANSYKAAIKKCVPLFDRPITSIRLADLQEVIDLYTGSSKSNLNNIKIVMSIVFDWAIKNDISQKNYAQYVEIQAKKTENHKPLTHFQVNYLLSEKKPNTIQKMIILYLYTGTRPSELINLKKEDVYLKEQYFRIKQSKTAAGVRIVPIADKILPIFTEFYHNKSNRLFDISIADYRAAFCDLYPDNTPHDTRSTFISFMTEKDVQQIIIQKIVGHNNGTVTGDVYTKLSLQPLLDAVNKL